MPSVLLVVFTHMLRVGDGRYLYELENIMREVPGRSTITIPYVPLRNLPTSS